MAAPARPVESCGCAALRLAKKTAPMLHWRGRFPAIEPILRRRARSGDSMAASRSSDWRISSGARSSRFPSDGLSSHVRGLPVYSGGTVQDSHLIHYSPAPPNRRHRHLRIVFFIYG